MLIFLRNAVSFAIECVFMDNNVCRMIGFFILLVEEFMKGEVAVF